MLERSFRHPFVQGAHAERRGMPRPKRTPREYELRQAERSGMPRDWVSAELTALWQASGTGAEFREKIAKAGYVLARGDRRTFVVVDRAGEVHALARRIDGARTMDIRAKLGDLSLDQLPSVAVARSSERRPPITAEDRLKDASYGMAQMHAVPPMPRKPSVRQRRFRTRPHIGGWRSGYSARRAMILADFAAKIAAAWLYAARHELAAIVAALKAEQREALRALREREQSQLGEHRRKKFFRSLAARQASRRTAPANPYRPPPRGRRTRRRERQYG
jgi:hypothetical protein